MKRRLALHTLGAAAVLPITPGWAGVAPGQPVPWPEVALLDGGRFGPAQAAGRAVVVVFWATTCPFCRRHNPHVEKLHRAAQGRALSVLTVARDRDADVVRRYALQQGYSFPITMDQAALASALSSRNVIPLTVTVDRQGRLKQAIAGEMFEEDVMELLQLADVSNAAAGPVSNPARNSAPATAAPR